MIFGDVWQLAWIPVVLGLGIFAFRRTGAGGVSTLAHLKRLWIDTRGVREGQWRLRGTRGVLAILSSFFVVLALARPQWGEIEEVVFEHAREVLVAVDLSASMLADDVRPSRLDRSRLLIQALVEELEGERVGLLVFAGTAFLQSPISADTEVLRDLLPELDPRFLPQGGTNYAAMLREAHRAFDRSGEADRYLVVLSDGEAHDDQWRPALEALVEQDVRIIALGVGTEEGTVLPDGDGGFVKDDRGAVVLSRLESGTLRALAEASGGTYRDAARWVDIASLVEETVDTGRQGEFVEERERRAIERFQWALAPGVLLLLLAAWLEMPVVMAGRLRLRGDSVRGAARVGLLVCAVAWPGSPAMAAETPPPDLAGLVAELIGKDALAAGDYARLAETTLAVGEAPEALPEALLRGAVGDALAATDEGERLGPEVADWPGLRARLERLQRQVEPPPQQRPPQEGGEGEQGESEEQSQGEQGQEGQQSEKGEGDPESESAGSDSESSAGEESGEDGKAGEPSGQQQAAGEQEAGDAGSSEAEGDGSNPEPSTNEGEELAHEDSGFGELDSEPEQETAASPEPASPAEPEEMRSVGGGTQGQEVLEGDELRWAEAMARLAEVRERDAPARLYQRMNEREGEVRREKGPSW